MARLYGLASLLLAFTVLLASAGTGDDTPKSKKFDFEKFFVELDTNKDNKLSRDEFLKMADRAKDKQKARENLTKTYDKLDPNKKGILKEKFKEFLDAKKKKDDKK